MVYNPVKLLKDGTDSPCVAKNWHSSGVVMDINKKIDDLSKLLMKVKESDASDDYIQSLAKDFDLETNEMIAIRDAFLEKWPAPQTQPIIDDVVTHRDGKFDFSAAQFLQLRPLKPLCLVRLRQDTGTIFYLDTEDNTLYQVPYTWYNHPGRAVKTTWAY